MPAFVGKSNSYRYYCIDEIEKAKLIALLRQLEMPLTRISEVMSLKGQNLTNAISSYWQEVEEDVRTKRKLVHYLKTHLEGKGENMFNIEIREVPEQKMLTIEKRVFQADLAAFIETSKKDLFTYVADSSQEVLGESIVIYHGKVDSDSDGPVEICIPFKGSLEPKGDMRVRLEPAHKEAYTRLTKAQVVFPDILAAYDAVSKYIHDSGKVISASPREVNLADWSKIADNEAACDVAFPFID